MGYAAPGPGGSIVLNSTAEFCRTLGDIPTYGLSGNRDEDAQEILVSGNNSTNFGIIFCQIISKYIEFHNYYNNSFSY